VGQVRNKKVFMNSKYDLKNFLKYFSWFFFLYIFLVYCIWPCDTSIMYNGDELMRIAIINLPYVFCMYELVGNRVLICILIWLYKITKFLPITVLVISCFFNFVCFKCKMQILVRYFFISTIDLNWLLGCDENHLCENRLICTYIGSRIRNSR
jgi:hypothetical protein